VKIYYFALQEVRHRQIAGTSCQVYSTASVPKGLADCTTGKLVGIVRTCRIEIIRSQALTLFFSYMEKKVWVQFTDQMSVGLYKYVLASQGVLAKGLKV